MRRPVRRGAVQPSEPETTTARSSRAPEKKEEKKKNLIRFGRGEKRNIRNGELAKNTGSGVPTRKRDLRKNYEEATNRKTVAPKILSGGENEVGGK